jgi:4-amino-4-deoxy-L-arabinose transferase-like glycosyltransferase
VHSVRTASVQQRLLALLLAIFLCKGIVTAYVFPPYTGHDEVAHYAYLRMFAEQGRIPLIPDLEEWRDEYGRPGYQPSFDRMPEEFYFPYAQYSTPDWFPGFHTVVYAVTFEGAPFPSGWIYTGNHPPLYYLLMTPVYWLFQDQTIEEQLHALRLAAIPFGMITVVLAYLTARTIFPRDRFLATTVPVFVAFQPQISYEAAMLNNDILAIACTSAVVYLIALGLSRRFPVWNCLVIGLFFGLAMLSKSTSVTSAPIIAIAMVFGLGWRNIREWLPKGALTAGVAGVLILPWLSYMWSTYGDFSALNRIRALQWWNYGGGDGRSIWSMLTDKQFFWERWQETWGGFGWRLIQFDPGLLRVILWLTLFATVGLAVYALRFLRAQREINAAEEAGEDVEVVRQHADPTLAIKPWQVIALITMGMACVIAYYAILQFGTTFSLTQARYYFPAIVPAAILLMLGLRSWFPQRWLPYVQIGVVLGLMLLNLVIYTAYVIPYWNPSA